MRAIVLSGGASLGATQVGALRALFNAGLTPDLLVGCSSGALNAAFLAMDPTWRGIDRMADLWRRVSRSDVYPLDRVRRGLRVLRNGWSVHPNEALSAFLQANGISENTGIDELKVPLYVTATDLHDGEMVVLGDDPDDKLLDALLSSTALVPLHPPHPVEGRLLVDGGLVSSLPLRVAVTHGATEVYAVQVLRKDATEVGGIGTILRRTVNIALTNLSKFDIYYTEMQVGVTLNLIRVVVEDAPDPRDFSQAERLFDVGYGAAMDSLARELFTSSLPSRSLTNQYAEVMES